MLYKKLTKLLFLSLLAIALTACGGANTTAVPDISPATIEPTLEPALPASTTPSPSAAPAPVSRDTPAPQTTDTAAPAVASVSFAGDVRPILENRCINCHGGESTKEGLDMKTFASLMAGSQNGPVITPGNADDSFLVRQLLEGKMPKRGPKLTPNEIQVIIDWINAGALEN